MSGASPFSVTIPQLPAAETGYSTDMIAVQQGAGNGSLGTMKRIPPALLVGSGANTTSPLTLTVASTGAAFALNWGAGLAVAEGALVPDFTVIAPLSNPSFEGQVTLSAGSSGSPGLVFESTSGSGLYRRVDGAIGVTQAGAEVAQLGPLSSALLNSDIWSNNALRAQGSTTVTNTMSYGWSDTAVAQSLGLNVPANWQAQVMGGFNGGIGAGLAAYASRDSVVSIRQQYAPSALFGAGGPPTTSGVGTSGSFNVSQFLPTTPLTASQISKLRMNMLIDTNDSPTKYTGAITSWDPAGTWIQVSGWYLSPGTGAAGIPSGNVAYINPVTKIWADNGIVTLTTSSFAQQAAGYEMDVVNLTGAFDTATNTPNMVGFDCASMGNARNYAGYLSRANTPGTTDFVFGYLAQTGSVAAFCYIPAPNSIITNGFDTQQQTGTGFHCSTSPGSGTPGTTYGFRTDQYGGTPFLASPYAQGTIFSVSAPSGSIDVGGQSAVTLPALNFHGNGSSQIDASISITAASTAGEGHLSYVGGAHKFSSSVVAQQAAINDDGFFLGYADLSVNYNITLATAVGYQRAIAFQTGDLNRWLFGTNNAAETGSNSGSNLFLQAFDDTGNLLGEVIGINRATGLVSISNGLSVTNGQINAAANTPLVLNSDAYDVVMGAGSALATTSATGFTHLPFMVGVPTAAPTINTSPSFIWNDAAKTLNVYSPSASAWFHISASAGAA